MKCKQKNRHDPAGSCLGARDQGDESGKRGGQRCPDSVCASGLSVPGRSPERAANLPGDPFHPHPHPQLAVPGWALCGKQEKSHPGASRGVLPVPGWALCWAPVASAFPGPDLTGADQGRSITDCTTSLAALMRFLSLASCFIYVLQSLLCELAFFLPSWTKAQFVSRPSCQSRDCPVSQERRHNSTIPLYQGKT